MYGMANQRTVLYMLVWIFLILCCAQCLDIKNLFQKAGVRRVRRAASCSVDNGGCDINCEETPIGALCSCSKGFLPTGDGRTCEDINECEIDNGGCHSTCHNNHGSYRCSCEEGYKLYKNETTCKDLDECEIEDICDHICINTAGSYSCQCYEGYAQYATRRCADIDECAENNGGCAHKCQNTEGSYKCVCNKGYSLHWNEKDCIRIENCAQISDVSKGRIALNGKKSLIECRKHQEFKHSKSPPSFMFSCGGLDHDKIDRSQSEYSWKTYYTPINNSICDSAGNSPIVKERKETFQMKQQCVLSEASSIPRQLRSSNMEEYDILAFSISCVRDPRRGRRKSKSTLAIYVKVLATANCKNGDRACINRKATRVTRQLRVAMKKAKKLLYLKFAHFNLVFGKKKGESSKCPYGSVWNRAKSTCVICGKGTIHDPRNNTCVNCALGYYQELPGQLTCNYCPRIMSRLTSRRHGTDLYESVDQCPGICQPGYHSSTGMEPCHACEPNTYQPFYGRTRCYDCKTRNENSYRRGTSFSTCAARLRCPPGHYFNVRADSCITCPPGFYQDTAGQNFCRRCPNGTRTHANTAKTIEECKSYECGGQLTALQGYIESPNYPGNFPINSKCVWTIDPPKGRRLLLVVPEIHLHSDERSCDNRLRMRNSVSKSSQNFIYDCCQTKTSPEAVTTRAKKLIIDFQSRGQHTAKGFRIPYVTYDENYEAIITDIVGDHRLYSPSYHQDILKDESSRRTLFDVLAKPQNYFALRKDEYRGLFRKEFIKFLQDKVISFLNPTAHP